MAEFLYGDYDSSARLRAWSAEDTVDGRPIVEIGIRGEVTAYNKSEAALLMAIDDVDQRIRALMEVKGELLGLAVELERKRMEGE